MTPIEAQLREPPCVVYCFVMDRPQKFEPYALWLEMVKGYDRQQAYNLAQAAYGHSANDTITKIPSRISIEQMIINKLRQELLNFPNEDLEELL